MSIYYTPQTREQASEWIDDNIPNQSTLVREHWDYGLPHGFLPDSAFLKNYQNQNKPLPTYTYLTNLNYDDEGEGKFDEVSYNLSKGDYLIIASSRLWKQIEKNPSKYPYTSEYYKKLFDEQLGYKLVKKFTSYPKIGPIEISDESAEETFQVFDHPTIYIFQNVDRFNKDKLFDMLYKNI